MRACGCVLPHHCCVFGRLFPDCFSEEPPVAAITYEWRLSFQDILSFLNPAQATCPAQP
jgi:hypothetical protein